MIAVFRKSIHIKENLTYDENAVHFNRINKNIVLVEITLLMYYNDKFSNVKPRMPFISFDVVVGVRNVVNTCVLHYKVNNSLRGR